MRAYIFEHLNGSDLVNAVITTALELPGYRDWCRHQHEIRDRAAHWARSISHSRYFPYGTFSSTPHSPSPDMWNQQRSEDARERIRLAIASMLNEGTLPIGVKARFLALTQFGIGGQTLYRHRDLWHPSDLSLSEEDNQCVKSGGLREEDLNDLPEV
ncbi:hypothetical protein [Phormidesmis priestleyi]